ncbi:MAG: hypothetical protein R3F14_20295 [Polyangiaceae bacterium]
MVHKRHWEIAVNLGEAEMRIGRYEAAVEHLSLALNDPGFARRSKTHVDSERQPISEWIAEGHLPDEAPGGRPGSSGARVFRCGQGGATVAEAVGLECAGGGGALHRSRTRSRAA